jgi:lipopolysaccharide assembly protein A
LPGRALRGFFFARTDETPVAYNAGFADAVVSEARMRLLAWIVKVGFFLLVLWFALKNTTPVPVRLTSSITWENVPLIVVMLVCIAVGALLGALALALPIYRMRREMTSLRQQAPAVATGEAAADRMASAARQSGAVVEVVGEPERR